ncbi:hypothetical protein V2J09_015878 [Rumex salicifolius]
MNQIVPIEERNKTLTTNNLLEGEMKAIGEEKPADDLIDQIKSRIRPRIRRIVPTKLSKSVKIPSSSTTTATTESTVIAAADISTICAPPRAGPPSGATSAAFEESTSGGARGGGRSDGRRSNSVNGG